MVDFLFGPIVLALWFIGARLAYGYWPWQWRNRILTIKETILIRSLLEAEAQRSDLPEVYATRTRDLIRKLDCGAFGA